MSKKLLQAGCGLALAVSVTLTSAFSAQANITKPEDAEFNASFSIPNPLIKGSETKIVIPVDCDLLGDDGEKTLAFVKQFGIWGHIKNETSITGAENHLRFHGIDREKIEKVRAVCIENF